jgi:hypothetical protein
MHEYTVNLHMHTSFSDGNATHEEISKAAARVGIDIVIVTDHNVWVPDVEKYYQHHGKRVLLLVGEEIHDEARIPQKNHLLVFGADRELSQYADNPQRLIDKVTEAGGISFIAHPFDPESVTFGEPDLSWENWNVKGFTGIELWNAMSEFKSLLKDRPSALFYALNPKAIASGPFSSTLDKWDELLNNGVRAVAVGGSDAHALRGKMGPFRKTLFPYEFHFQAVNTHILTEKPMNDHFEASKQIVLNAIQRGRAFIGYDLPAPSTGFRFQAKSLNAVATMGEEIRSDTNVTFQIHLPKTAECILIKNGENIKTWDHIKRCQYATSEPGIYRVEAYLKYRGRRRGWIFSNPIFFRGKTEYA